MICPNCKKEINITSDAVFCPECGFRIKAGNDYLTRFSSHEGPDSNRQPKPAFETGSTPSPVSGKAVSAGSTTTLLIAIFGGAAAVILVVFGILLMRRSDSDVRDKKVTSVAESAVAGNSTDNPAQTAEESFVQTAANDDTDTVAEVNKSSAPGSPLLDYYNNTLLDQYGLFGLDRTVTVAYSSVTISGYVQGTYSNLDSGVRGIAGYDIRDLDSDGDDELLTVRIENSTIIMTIYENNPQGTIHPAAETVVAKIGNPDLDEDNIFHITGEEQKCSICILPYGTNEYIATYLSGIWWQLGDGVDNSLCVQSYDNGVLNDMFYDEYSGSEEDGMDSKRSSDRRALSNLGFSNTSEDFQLLDMQIKNESGMARIFEMSGSNERPYDWTATDKFYNTGDPSFLGVITYRFASGGATDQRDAYVSTSDSSSDYSSDYILPGSDSRYLTLADLAGLDANQCRLARNELFARHGRRFKDDSIQSYFDSKSWYYGYIDPDDFDESVFNDYEMSNRDLIVQYEESMGYR